MNKPLVRSLLIAAALAVAAPACVTYTPLTPTQLAERGTHRYAGVTRDKATDACAAALATLGYQVTVKDPRAGTVKTAPKTISVSATGGAGYANAVEDGVAWSIAIEDSGAGAVVHATPRGFRNGSEVHDENMWVAEVMDPKFTDLWHEIDSLLSAKNALGSS